MNDLNIVNDLLTEYTQHLRATGYMGEIGVPGRNVWKCRQQLTSILVTMQIRYMGQHKLLELTENLAQNQRSYEDLAAKVREGMSGASVSDKPDYQVAKGLEESLRTWLSYAQLMREMTDTIRYQQQWQSRYQEDVREIPALVEEAEKASASLRVECGLDGYPNLPWLIETADWLSRR